MFRRSFSVLVVLGLWPAQAPGFSAEIPFLAGAIIDGQQNDVVQIGGFDTGKYIVDQRGQARFQMGQTEWMVDCSGTPCRAWASVFEVYWSGSGNLHLNADREPGSRVSLKRANRTRDFNADAGPLSAFEVDQLRMGGLLIVEEREKIVATLDLVGIGVLLDFMRWADNGQSAAATSEPSPLAYMKTVEESAKAPRDILVPFTKPQVQFAIREQNGTPFVP